jgi:hypothetical protein
MTLDSEPGIVADLHEVEQGFLATIRAARIQWGRAPVGRARVAKFVGQVRHVLPEMAARLVEYGEGPRLQ